MPLRSLGDDGDLQWVSQCFDREEPHVHVSLYLLRGGDETTLIDTGSHHHLTDIDSDLAELEATGHLGEGVDNVVLTHGDLPHIDNARRFKDRWGSRIVSPSAKPAKENIGDLDIDRCIRGEEMVIGNRRCTFTEPILADRWNSVWMYDYPSATLFTADGFGCTHSPDRCTTVIDGAAAFPEVEELARYNLENLPWIQYIDVEKLSRAVDGLLDRFEIEVLASTHGNPVVGAEVVEAYIDERFLPACEAVRESYPLYV